MLSPPTIVEPVTPCLRQIRLRGQLPDSTVKVFDDQGTVAVGVAKETEDLVNLPPGVSLRAGQRLWAEQETADDRSDSSPQPVTVLRPPVPGDLELLHSPVPLIECGRCIWLGGVFPGAIVSLTVGHAPPVSLESNTASAKITIGPGMRGFDPSTPVVVSQNACGLPGGGVRLPDPLPVSADDWKVTRLRSRGRSSASAR